MKDAFIQRLLASDEPAVRYRAYVDILGGNPQSPEAEALRREIPAGPAATVLLSERDEQGKLPYHPYNKWVGAHWVLACLAEIGHPPGDASLKPLLEQSYRWLLSQHHLAHNTRTIAGRVRRCASQEGYCIYYSLALGIADERTQELAERLVKWQWPDGGWNCDKKAEAQNSSFWESLLPLRALNLYARRSGDPAAARAVERAVEVFLKRELFKRQKDGSVMVPEFTSLFYPFYWRYNILAGLKGMVEAGCISDPRCRAGLDWLESKRLPDGGFPAEMKFYRVSEQQTSGQSRFDWGGRRPRKANDYVTLEALYVLRAAGRLEPSLSIGG